MKRGRKNRGALYLKSMETEKLMDSEGREETVTTGEKMESGEKVESGDKVEGGEKMESIEKIEADGEVAAGAGLSVNSEPIIQTSIGDESLFEQSEENSEVNPTSAVTLGKRGPRSLTDSDEGNEGNAYKYIIIDDTTQYEGGEEREGRKEGEEQEELAEKSEDGEPSQKDQGVLDLREVLEKRKRTVPVSLL